MIQPQFVGILILIDSAAIRVKMQLAINMIKPKTQIKAAGA